MDRDFKSAFCERYNCREEDFEKTALLKVLHRRSLPIAVILLKIAPGRFKTDFQILQHFGDLTPKSNFLSDAKDVRNDYYRMQDFGFFRRAFKMRISGQRLLKLASEVWGRGESRS